MANLSIYMKEVGSSKLITLIINLHLAFALNTQRQIQKLLNLYIPDKF